MKQQMLSVILSPLSTTELHEDFLLLVHGADDVIYKNIPDLSGEKLETGLSKFHLALILCFVYLLSSCLLTALETLCLFQVQDTGSGL